jgi:hypothetical protein
MSHELKDKNRRKVTLFTSKIGEVLPLYYEQDNAKLISLLDQYYKFLDSSGDQSFSSIISEIHHSRDISQTDTDYLDELISEIGNGLTASSFFQQPRLMSKLLARFYQSKGSINSAEGFFKGFFNEQVTVEYPKTKIFIVAESEIGYESQKFIQDDGLYQIFSILIKIGLSTQDYENLYKKFVHPAGFHFAGEVLLEEDTSLTISLASADPLEVEVITTPVFSEASLTIEPSTTADMTALYDSDGTEVRISLLSNIEYFEGDSIGNLDVFYPNILTVATPNSFTYDDSANSARPDNSMTYETTENDMFTRYLSNITDSSI